MNRIIIIGNGFDKAHGLPTGYKDFIDAYWNDFHKKVFSGDSEISISQFGQIYNPVHCSDDFASVELDQDKSSNGFFVDKGNSPLSELSKSLTEFNNSSKYKLILKFKNEFFEHISQQCSLINWVDVENEYYDALKKLLLEDDSRKRNEKVKKLNTDFCAAKGLLEQYLINIIENTEIKRHPSIREAFSSPIGYEDISHRKQKTFLDSIIHEIDQADNGVELLAEAIKNPFISSDEANRQYILKKLEDDSFKKRHCTPNTTLVLNFNYTQTADKLYVNGKVKFEVINIHGGLNNKKNPIIFGYGDELDDDYKRIEKLQDNDFLDNIKSIKYHQTRNYRELLSFIQSDIYQVFVMGHSCGNSDRTLLNTLFEHENCISVKVFYQQFENGSDDYSNLIRNISRNFNDKPRMRDVVVNWEDCSPLVPVSSK